MAINGVSDRVEEHSKSEGKEQEATEDISPAVSPEWFAVGTIPVFVDYVTGPREIACW